MLSNTQQPYYQKKREKRKERELTITEVNREMSVQFNNRKGYLTDPAM